MKLELKQVGRIYGSGLDEAPVLQGISLTLSEGDRVILTGESGAGKSTLLRILGLIDRGFSGEYFIDGKNSRDFKAGQLQKMRNQVFGFIFQEYALVEDDTVFENVKIPLLYSGKKKKEYKEEVEKILQKLELLELMGKRVRSLSGGQRQRVAIARALVNRPKIIIADEPTASLNARVAEQVLQTMQDYLDETKILIMATHDLTKLELDKVKNIRLTGGHITL